MFFKRIAARLKEPSSWAGLSIIGAMAGLNPAYLSTIHGLFTAGMAALAVFIPEKTTSV